MKQRLTRILIYEGSSAWIQSCLEDRGVKGSQRMGNGLIKEAIVGELLEEVIERTILPELTGDKTE